MLKAVANTMSKVIHRVDFEAISCSRVSLLFQPIKNGVAKSWISRIIDPFKPESLIGR